MKGSQDILSNIKSRFVKLDSNGVIEGVRKALENNVSPLDIVSKVIAEGMGVIGEKFRKGEYFLPELIIASEISKEILKILDPYLKAKKIELKKLGKVVIGTVKGDIHDIGKNIVATLLEVAGFEVIDLGVDVSPEKFIETVKKYNANIVAMSALLTTTMPEMKVVIDELKKAGLRSKVKVIIGGAPVTEEYAKIIGADGYGETAMEGVKICKQWLSE